MLLRVLTSILALTVSACVSSQKDRSKAVPADRLVIVDAASAFDDLWRKNLPADQQLKAFEEMVTSKLPGYYRLRLQHLEDPSAQLQNELRAYNQYRQKFLNTILNLRIFVPKAYDKFRLAFPDFTGEHHVHIVQSFNEMDVGNQRIDSKTHLIFGAESIAKGHKVLDFERKLPLMHHEMFHLYHDQFFTEREGLLPTIWREGLATLAAEELNPNADLAQLGLKNPARLMEKCEAIYTDLLKHLETRLRVPVSDTYENYFLKSSKHSWIPKRAGYCIGYKFAKWARKTKNLDKLARLQLPEVDALMQAYLKEQLP